MLWAIYVEFCSKIMKPDINFRNMLLHDFWAGCNGFATSRGSYFIPRGEAPRDEMTPKG